MNFYTITPLSIFSDFLLAFCASWFFNMVLTPRWPSPRRWFILPCLGILHIITYLLSDSPFAIVLYFGVYLLLMRLWFLDRMKRIAMILLVFFFCMITSELFNTFFILMRGYDRVQVRQDLSLYALMLFFAAFLLLVMLFFTAHLLRRHNLLSFPYFSGCVILLAGQTFSLYTVYFPLFFPSHANPFYYSMLFWFLILETVFLLAVSAFFTRRLHRQATLESENLHLTAQLEQQLLYYEELQGQVMAFRQLRHDIINHSATIEALYSSGHEEQAAEYLATLKNRLRD